MTFLNVSTTLSLSKQERLFQYRSVNVLLSDLIFHMAHDSNDVSHLHCLADIKYLTDDFLYTIGKNMALSLYS